LGETAIDQPLRPAEGGGPVCFACLQEAVSGRSSSPIRKCAASIAHPGT
jgi:hypothetical protein